MQIEVVTPKGIAVSAEADEVVAPGQNGEFGVLPGHSPFISAMRPGVLRVMKGGQEQRLAVGTGLVEVTGTDKVVVMTELMAKVEDIDVVAARKELDEADQMAKAGDAGAEQKRLWAQARIDATARKS